MENNIRAETFQYKNSNNIRTEISGIINNESVKIKEEKSNSRKSQIYMIRLHIGLIPLFTLESEIPSTKGTELIFLFLDSQAVLSLGLKSVLHVST